MAKALLVEGPIEPVVLLTHVQSDRYGAVVIFSGNVRDFSRGKRVLAMEYTAYQPLALSELQRIASEAERRCAGACAIAHRVGPVPIGDSSVYVAAAATHRADAFDACRWAIDTIKECVPIWKRETYDDGVVWVEGDRTIAVDSPERDND
ncbi:MAG: molybdenum cofactor biosynthesis protein MoaE [Capsulimonadaceae bacterium]|nr:molybdenum cofactor biosynthesis protein MoaE [Capsulimonadaceae bacterium]